MIWNQRETRQRRSAGSLKRKGKERGTTQGSVWGHGAAFLPKVKGKSCVINEVGMEKRYRVTITPGKHFQKHTQVTVACCSDWLWRTTADSRPSHPPSRAAHTQQHRPGWGWGGGKKGWWCHCHDADLSSGPEWYFRGGERGHLVSLPLWPPPATATSQLFPRKSAGTRVCQGL